MIRLHTAVALLLLSVPFANVAAQPLGTASASRSTCGVAPTCSEPSKCESREVTDQRDTRDCRWTLIFGMNFNDPACEAAQASINQKVEFMRAVAQQEYRQCLVAQESHRVGCEVRQSEWENCMAKELPQFPPRTLSDRRFLYHRCIRAGGKDEFTEDCCIHLYAADRSTMGVCTVRSQSRK